MARRGAELYLEMIFGSGVYHADPHPGNLVLLPSGVIGLLDFGMVGRIDEPLREDIEDLFMAVASQDAVQLTQHHHRASARCRRIWTAWRLFHDLADFISYYANQTSTNSTCRRTQRTGGDGPPLSHHVAGADRDADQSAGHAGRNLAALVAALQPDGVDAADAVEDAAAATFAVAAVKKLRRFTSKSSGWPSVLPRGLASILEQVQAGRTACTSTIAAWSRRSTGWSMAC